jgi:hypothetical protein
VTSVTSQAAKRNTGHRIDNKRVADRNRNTNDRNTASAGGSRTLAWHIAHQPFGVVAGAKQYKHAKLAMFYGYAGTSASGFAAEVVAEESVALLD